MRIAVIGAKGLPPEQGGIEHYCAELYPRIVAQGHSVDLFARSSYTKRPWLAQDRFKGVRVISLPCLIGGGIEAVASSAMGAIASLKANYDIIHFHALGPSLFAWLPSLDSSARIVATCHGLDWQREKWGSLGSSIIRAGEGVAARYAHKIVVVSKDLESYFSNTHRRETIYIPTAPASYASSDANFSYGKSLGLTSKRYLVFLGRLVPEKCPDLLVKAFQTLRPDGWKLVLVGDSSDTSSFTSKLMRSAEGDKDIIFAGQLQGSQLAEIVRGAGLFVLPSNLEGMPLALLEAMQEGIPVVASNIPTLQHLLCDGRGLLFQAGDSDSCIRSIDWAINHAQEMADMAKKAKDYVKRYHSWDAVAADHLKLYDALAVQDRGSSAVKQLQNVLKP